MVLEPTATGSRLLGDRYELGTRLGEGGMGVVYKAHDRMLRRTVAIKVFRDGSGEPARTASETQLLAGLNHPALVTLFDAHIGDDAPRYLVMEYVDGPTLQKSLAIGPLSAATVARVAADLAAGLHAVHEAGIVHRDIKPSNVLLRPSNVPGEGFHAKLADFGIAHLVDSTRLTLPGTVVGSAAYLSPEQVTGSPPDPASDVYSLGLVLLESLTGQRAFAQDAVLEAALARLSADPVIPASVAKEWASLVIAMTARDPEQRPSALDVVVAVNAMPSITTPVGNIGAVETVAMADATGMPDTMPTRVLAAQTTVTEALPPATTDAAASVQKPRRRRRWITAAIVAGVLAIAVAGGLAIWGSGAQPAAPPAVPALDPTPTPQVSEPAVVTNPAPVTEDPAPVTDDGNGNSGSNGNSGGNGNGNGNDGNNGNNGNGNGND